MNKAHLELIESRYADACNEYLKAFCERYELQYVDDPWVGDDVGSVACVGHSYFIDMSEIRFMLRSNVDWDEYLRYLDYNIDASLLGLDTINLRSWCKGCPRLSREQIEELQQKRKELDDLVEEYKNNNKKLF